MGRGLRNDLRGTAAFGDREVKSTNETGQEGMIRWGKEYDFSGSQRKQVL